MEESVKKREKEGRGRIRKLENLTEMVGGGNRIEIEKGELKEQEGMQMKMEEGRGGKYGRKG